jgi:hypothetical protein
VDLDWNSVLRLAGKDTGLGLRNSYGQRLQKEYGDVIRRLRTEHDLRQTCA